MRLCVSKDPTSSSDCPLLAASTAKPDPFKLHKRITEGKHTFWEPPYKPFPQLSFYVHSHSEKGKLRHREAKHQAPNHKVGAELSWEATFCTLLTILSHPCTWQGWFGQTGIGCSSQRGCKSIRVTVPFLRDLRHNRRDWGPQFDTVCLFNALAPGSVRPPTSQGKWLFEFDGQTGTSLEAVFLLLSWTRMWPQSSSSPFQPPDGQKEGWVQHHHFPTLRSDDDWDCLFRRTVWGISTKF